VKRKYVRKEGGGKKHRRLEILLLLVHHRVHARHYSKIVKVHMNDHKRGHSRGVGRPIPQNGKGTGRPNKASFRMLCYSLTDRETRIGPHQRGAVLRYWWNTKKRDQYVTGEEGKDSIADLPHTAVVDENFSRRQHAINPSTWPDTTSSLQRLTHAGESSEWRGGRSDPETGRLPGDPGSCESPQFPRHFSPWDRT